ncbi:MAG: bifunctional RNase H/acid phosphatase [Nocardioidaceae bacterium]|nr:bifunctional RNase H/acid phosphatase [Nocardioidaceae bacterium]
MTPQRVIIEADGGSRGNPGPAAYGALVRDADSGEVLAQRAECIGVATNNVAEYRGLIAGLELLQERAPRADVEVRMDSKLVIEQMAGRWKVKHPDMRPLALHARRLAPSNVRWTWVPRERNGAADALLNAALDGTHEEATPGELTEPDRPVAPAEPSQPYQPLGAGVPDPLVSGRAADLGQPTTLVLLRHGVTDVTQARRFSGSGGSNPRLNEIGRAQAQRAAAWLGRRGGIDVVVTSPLRRAWETAELAAATLGLEVDIEEDLAEASFGLWDGLTFSQVAERFPAELEAWLGSSAVAPPGGESYDDVATRARTVLDDLLATYGGRTVLAVSHVTPIKMLTRLALDAPLEVVHRLQVAPASLTTLAWWADGVPALQQFSYVPE